MAESNSAISKVLRLHELSRRLTREVQRMDRELCAPHDLSPAQWHALVEIERVNSLNMNELASQLCIHRSTLTRLVDQLEKKNLVRRQPDPSDRRQTRLEATPGGRDLAEEILADSVQAQWELLSGIAAAERLSLAMALETLVSAHERWDSVHLAES